MTSRSRGVRRARAQVEFWLTPAARANPAVAAWRWRYELLGAASLAVLWTALGIRTAAAVTIGLLVLLAVTASFPAGREFLVARMWCIVTPHRVRAGCAQAWIHSRDGKIPAVILTRHYPFGERVYLWCRAGICAEDLFLARELLAAACWAEDVRVSRHPGYAHVVALDVIRHGHLIAPPDHEQVNGTGWTAPRWPPGPLDAGPF